MTVEIKDGEIIIRVQIKDLSGVAFEGLNDVGMLDETDVDFDEVAKDIVSELEREDEEGSTLVHFMFDQAVRDASENGSTALDFPE